MYTNSVVYLERKFNKFVALYGNIKEKELGEMLESPKQDNQQPNFIITDKEGSTTSN